MATEELELNVTGMMCGGMQRGAERVLPHAGRGAAAARVLELIDLEPRDVVGVAQRLALAEAEGRAAAGRLVHAGHVGYHTAKASADQNDPFCSLSTFASQAPKIPAQSDIAFWPRHLSRYNKPKNSRSLSTFVRIKDD